MFGKNTYQHYFLENVPLSLQTRESTSVDDLNDNEVHLQYHHGMHNEDIYSGHYLPANNAPAINEAPALLNGFNEGAFFQSMVGPTKQTAVKKDRHSKIYTAQGPRDRRVRLSIDIARKFFDLQEMLGFDKPSKTLDWLLSKSKAAIQELVESKTAKCMSNCSSQEEVLSASENCNSFGEDSKGKSVMPNFRAANNISEKANLAKESRAERRAKARERTKEKMCIKQLNEARIPSSRNHHHQALDQVSGTRDCPLSHIFGFDQQNVTENWDYSNFVSQSNQLCAILDQHKFIN